MAILAGDWPINASTTSGNDLADKLNRLASGALTTIGGVLTGPLTLAADPTVALGAATKQYADAKAAAVQAGVDQAKADAATAATAANTKVAKAGDTMSGYLTLVGAPTVANHAATKAYVDGASVAYAASSGSANTANSATNAGHANTAGYATRAGSVDGSPVPARGDVGSHFFGRSNAVAPGSPFGTTVPGSSLFFEDQHGSTGTMGYGGTWRLDGAHGAGGNTLFVRIS